MPVEEIHFHEVGAVDTIVDVCGAVLAFERLGVERAWFSPPLVGSGTVHCAHGEMPVPAPATAEILRGLPFVAGGEGERLTPTGAALLAVLAEPWNDAAGATPTRGERIGYGAGTRETTSGPPNLVRVRLAEAAGADSRRVVLEFSFHVDDATGEELGHCLERLREGGALDVWHSAIAMKKGRPGVLVGGLAAPESREAIEALVFEHSSTFGVRWTTTSRTECERSFVEVEIFGERVRVKRRHRPGAPDAVRACDLAAEYEDVASLAREGHGAVRELSALAVARALELLGGESAVE